jgi:hypothetical protein
MLVGVLTDLIIGTASDIASVPDQDVPGEVLPTLDIKGFGLVDLGVLLAVVKGVEFDPGLEQFPIVAGEEAEDGPWVHGFPGDLADHLAGLSSDDISSLTTSLLQDEQFEGWTAADLSERLAAIQGFVLEAKKQQKPLHVRTSL